MQNLLLKEDSVKIYKAIWIDGPIDWYDKNLSRYCPNYPVVLKKLNNSKNITTKELNEVIHSILYQFV